ncbi:MAG: hypothetical protein AABM67_05820 [Acidobacteriota bacterium]
MAALVGGWLYWNRPTRSDLANYAPSDSLAYLEANDLSEMTEGVEQTAAWKSLASLIGARSNLLPSRWLIRIAKWTGIGSAETVVLARSQIAIVFTGAEVSETGPTLNVKPLAVLIVETHTSPRRMRPVLEKQVDEFARRIYGQPQLIRKQIDGVDLSEWSADSSRRIVVAFVETTAIVGNDEASVLNCAAVRLGKRGALTGEKQFQDSRTNVKASNAAVFGFVSKPGIKSLLQAFALYRSGASADAISVSRIFADTIGNLADGVGCSATFVDGMVEDRCSVILAEGLPDKLRTSFTPEDRFASSDLPFVPSDTHSVSLYHFRDVETLWRDLNAAVSSHADLVGAIAARPMLRTLLKPYGIDDPDIFVHAVGPHLEVIRPDNISPSVLVAEALDRGTLKKLAQKRLGPRSTTETVGNSEMMVSSSDNWAMSLSEHYFLSGPSEAVRRCLQARAQSTSLSSVDSFRKAERLIDVSLPLTTVTYANDQHAAISFVELFSQQERPTFSANGPAIDQAARSLPYAVSVTMMKDKGLEWTSRSSFGLVGSLIVAFTPESPR